MRKVFFSFWSVIKESISQFVEDRCLKLSAALAYYTVFSLAPMLLVIIMITSRIFGMEAVDGKIFGHINELVGDTAAFQIQEIIKNISLKEDTLLATIMGVITLALGATGVFSEIQDSINYIWKLKPKPKKGFLALVINRLLSFSMVVSLGFLLMVSLLINAILMAINERLTALFPDITVVLFHIINFILTFGVISFLFAIIFKVLPDARIQWKEVSIGAMVTAGLFMLGKFALGFYLQYSDLDSTYGAAGSIIIILVWVYYSSIILFFGAEFTQIYALNHGTGIKPNAYAVWVNRNETEEGQQVK